MPNVEIRKKPEGRNPKNVRPNRAVAREEAAFGFRHSDFGFGAIGGVSSMETLTDPKLFG